MREIDYDQLELLVVDCDGVLTDGRIYLTQRGEEMKVFHVRDGSGMKYWARAGKRMAIITGRDSPVVQLRAEELGVHVVRRNVKRKLPAYAQVLSQLGVEPHQAVVIGDDLTDLPMLQRCGLAACPADAVGEVRNEADYICRLPGGQGCVREVIEMVLKHDRRWDAIMSRYRQGETGADL